VERFGDPRPEPVDGDRPMSKEPDDEACGYDGKSDKARREDAAPQGDPSGTPSARALPPQTRPFDAGAETMIVFGAMPIVQVLDQT
jgi:hypothetical protein